ncbi:MAG TPA: hypothetical protein VKA49_05320 [Flavitalea sp.]|nr:hypothetical protein [Flavitalea sp.]
MQLCIYIYTFSIIFEGTTFKYDYCMIRIHNAHTGAAIFAGLSGTTLMTSFSYLVAQFQKENFREPELLAILLRRLVPELNKKYSKIAGWNIHYAVGIAFAIIYSTLWEKNKLKASVKSGLLLGGLSGLLAIIIWKATFLLHPSPPNVEFKRYYGNLFVAHLVFGAFASIGYKIAKSNLLLPRITISTD